MPESDPSSSPDQQWSIVEYQSGAQYACTVFEQLVGLIKASLIFNGTLAVAGVTVISERLFIVDKFPLGFFVLTIIAILFNFTSVVSHTVLWRFIGIVLIRQNSIEYSKKTECLRLHSELRRLYLEQENKLLGNAKKQSLLFAGIVSVAWLVALIWIFPE